MEGMRECRANYKNLTFKQHGVIKEDDGGSSISSLNIKLLQQPRWLWVPELNKEALSIEHGLQAEISLLRTHCGKRSVRISVGWCLHYS